MNVHWTGFLSAVVISQDFALVKFFLGNENMLRAMGIFQPRPK